MSVFGEGGAAPRRGGGSVRVSAGAMAAAIVVVILAGIGLFLAGMEIGRRQGIQEGIARMMPSSVPAEQVLGPMLPSTPRDTVPPSPDSVAPAGSTGESEAAPSVGAVEGPGEPLSKPAEQPATATPPRESPRAAELEVPLGRPAGWEAVGGGDRPAPAGAGRAWAIQVLATPDEREALLLQQRLEGAGYPVFVTPTRKDGLTWHRVRVGTYSSETEARRAARELRRKFGLPTWVLE